MYVNPSLCVSRRTQFCGVQLVTSRSRTLHARKQLYGSSVVAVKQLVMSQLLFRASLAWRCMQQDQASWIRALAPPPCALRYTHAAPRCQLALKAAGKAVPAPTPIVERIEDKELHVEAAESYLAYAMSVIVGRALPDVRDGLKPVHRRILFAMHELGLHHNKPFKKCARVVGEVLGKYHPHGDSAVYEALVRMAQDFSMRQALVAGHGNFGSVDDDPPAAMRYTECRLQGLAEDMLLADLRTNAVNFRPTFDASEEEPVVLPAKVPQLLINGASGIAVSLATRIPTHNMNEVVAGLKALVHDPDITVAQLMKFIPGPDFPTGGEILLGSGISEAYETGHGSVVMRGKANIVLEGLERRGRVIREVASNGGAANHKSLIVISELPYQTNKAAFVEQIAELVEARVLEGVADVRDESDRDGIRVVVEVKRTFPPEVVLNQLYKHTKLQSRFACNMVALVNGTPKTLTLKDFLKHFLDFRCEVIMRRAQYQLGRAEARLHIVQGLLVAISHLDEVVELVRIARDSSTARASLQSKFSLSSEQGDAVLALTLRRLTALEASKLQEEQQQLQAILDSLTRLLGSRQEVLELVVHEADEIVSKYGSPRRSVLTSDPGEVKDIDVVPNMESLLIYSRGGYIKRMHVNNFAAQRRGGKGKAGAKLKEDDLLEDIVRVMDHDNILLFTSKGQVFRIKAYLVPSTLSRYSLGTPIRQLLKLAQGNNVTCLLPVPEQEPEDSQQFVMMLTKQAQIKSMNSLHISSINTTGKKVFTMGEGDELCWVGRATPECSVLVANNTGNVIHFKASSLRPRGRMAGGLSAMRLKEGQQVVSMCILPARPTQAASNGEDAKEVLAGANEVDTASDARQADTEASIHKTGTWLQAGGSATDQDNEGASGGERIVADPSSSAEVLFVTENGYGKRVPIGSFRKTSRNLVGVYGIKLQPNDRLLTLKVVQPGDEVAVGTAKGVVIRLTADSIRRTGRQGKGVKIMNLEHSDTVQTVTVIPATSLSSQK